jgi:hypothetical protein
MSRLAYVLLILSVLALACEAKLPEPDSPGARLYAERCGSGCHRVYAPGLMKFEMWKLTLQRMQGELVRRGLPPLNSEEMTILLDYLRRHSDQ